MVMCSAVGCNNRSSRKSKRQLALEDSNTRVTFHRFPQKKEVRDEWIERIKIKSWAPTKTCVLCSIHFEDSCFLPNTNKLVLRSDAVPTLFANHCKRMQAKQVKKRQVTLKGKHVPQQSKSQTVSKIKEIEKKLANNRRVPVSTIEDGSATSKSVTGELLTEKLDAVPRFLSNYPKHLQDKPVKKRIIAKEAEMSRYNTLVDVQDQSKNKTADTSPGIKLSPTKFRIIREPAVDLNDSSTISSSHFNVKRRIVIHQSDASKQIPSLNYNAADNLSSKKNENNEVSEVIQPSANMLKLKERIRGISDFREKLTVLHQTRKKLLKRVAAFKSVVKVFKLRRLTVADDFELLRKEIIRLKQEQPKENYNTEFKEFAKTLYRYSPRSYVYVRESLNRLLPHPNIVTKWYKEQEVNPTLSANSVTSLEEDENDV